MRKKGYQTTEIDFLKAASNCVEEANAYGFVEVNLFGDMSILSQLWPSVKNIIHSCNDRMISFIKKFGINKDVDLYPFCEKFKTVTDMLEAYID